MWHKNLSQFLWCYMPYLEYTCKGIWRAIIFYPMLFHTYTMITLTNYFFTSSQNSTFSLHVHVSGIRHTLYRYMCTMNMTGYQRDINHSCTCLCHFTYIVQNNYTSRKHLLCKWTWTIKLMSHSICITFVTLFFITQVDSIHCDEFVIPLFVWLPEMYFENSSYFVPYIVHVCWIIVCIKYYISDDGCINLKA